MHRIEGGGGGPRRRGGASGVHLHPSHCAPRVRDKNIICVDHRHLRHAYAHPYVYEEAPGRWNVMREDLRGGPFRVASERDPPDHDDTMKTPSNTSLRGSALLGFLLLLSAPSVLAAQSRSKTTSNAEVVRASVSFAGAQGNQLSSDSLISLDARYVAFSSDATNLVPGDTNAVRDVFLRGRDGFATERLSVDSAGVQGNGLSSVSDPCPISDDDRYVVFYSDATNLVAGDTNGVRDVFVRDRLLGTTTRVSVSSAGVQGNGRSSEPTISADGRYVAFYSDATTLVPNDTNLVRDCFVRDLQTNTTTRISVSSAGAEGNALSSGPIIAAGGRYVAFYSSADTLVAGDTNAFRDCFVRDLQTNTTTRVSLSSTGAQGNKLSSEPTISADGRYVCFYSDATNLVSGDTNAVRDVFVRDRTTNTTTRVSISSTGSQGNARSERQAISGNGRFVVFDSNATNMVAAPDTNLAADTFLHDRTKGTTDRMNQNAGGTQGNGESTDGSLSFEGNCIAFGSVSTNLVPHDTNHVEDVFVRRRLEPLTILPLVVNPTPDRTLVFELTGRAEPMSIPVVVLLKTDGTVLQTLVGSLGSNRVEMRPATDSALPQGRIELHALGFRFVRRGGLGWIPASVIAE